jgi:hypothetical protein
MLGCARGDYQTGQGREDTDVFQGLAVESEDWIKKK